MSTGFRHLRLDGNGNKFIFVFDATSDVKNRRSIDMVSGMTKEKVTEICRNGSADGVIDGLIFLEKVSADTFRWKLYNSDGSTPDFCANGARCVGYLAANEFGLSDFTKINLQTELNEVAIFQNQSKEAPFSVELPICSVICQEGMMIGHGDQPITYSIINTGVPHLVTLVDNIDFKDKKEMAMSLRYPPECEIDGKNLGANVTFVERRSSYIKAISFERGVEDFTQSCGTGAVAAKWLVKDHFSFRPNLKVVMPGGDLFVELREVKNSGGKNWEASLGGQVKVI